MQVQAAIVQVAVSTQPAGSVRPPPPGLTTTPQLCTHHQAGHCRKVRRHLHRYIFGLLISALQGYWCTFAHSAQELVAWEQARQRGEITAPLPVTGVISRSLPRARPRNHAGRFVICRHYEQTERCSYGEKCICTSTTHTP